MMRTTKKVLKWIGIVLASLVGLLLVALVVVYMLSTQRLNKSYAIPATTLTIATTDAVTDAATTDDAVIAEGQRQFSTRGCADCHGDNGAGTVMLDDPMIGTIMASNLTSGQGGIGGSYQDADWVRSIRHGVGPDGKPLVIMPSHEYNPINDGDLATMLAYIKALPPVDQAQTPISVGPLDRILLLTGMATLLPAEVIDHAAPRPQAVAKGATVAYGQYLSNSCIGCHGASLSGGPMPGVPGEEPFPRNLTPDMETGLGTWQEADFVTAMRTGIRPDGSELTAGMPWQAFSVMTDEELSALWQYLQSVPAKPYGNR